MKRVAVRIVAVLWLVASVAHPAVERIAVAIGCNEGLASERPLLYAARDAENMVRLLQKQGNFAKDRTYLLVNPSVGGVREVLTEVRGRIKEVRRAGSQALIFLYYSGHGSAEALHIHGKRLGRNELSAYFESLDAELRIMLLDACESGDYLRHKGARLLQDHTITKTDELENRGSVVLASSSRGELAQESEAYQGAVFTHHFMNALKGLADFDGDRAVGLLEAYAYASTATKRERLLSSSARQHPSYDFDLVGKSDIILTRLNEVAARLLIDGLDVGQLDIHDAVTMELAARVYPSGRDSILFHLPARRYIASFTDGDALHVRRLDLTWGQEARLTRQSFRRKPNLSLYSRKGGPVQQPHGIQLAVSGLAILSERPVPRVSLSYVIRQYRLLHEFSLGFATFAGHDARGHLSVSTALPSLAYGFHYSILSHPYLLLLIGARGDYTRAIQHVSDHRFNEAPEVPGDRPATTSTTVRANVFSATVPLTVEFLFPFRIWLAPAVECGFWTYSDYVDGGRRFSPGIVPKLSLGYQF
jgi:hypothetical protein